MYELLNYAYVDASIVTSIYPALDSANLRKIIGDVSTNVCETTKQVITISTETNERQN